MRGNVILDTIVDAAVHRERTELEKAKALRYVRLFDGKLNGFLAQEGLERVCVALGKAIVRKNRDTYRTDRKVIKPVGSNREQWEKYHRTIAENASDREFLALMKMYDTETGAKLSEKEAQWFNFIQDGTIAGSVHEYFELIEPKKSQEPEPAVMGVDDVPF